MDDVKGGCGEGGREEWSFGDHSSTKLPWMRSSLSTGQVSCLFPHVGISVMKNYSHFKLQWFSHDDHCDHLAITVVTMQGLCS